jgi:hypothetical protein
MKRAMTAIIAVAILVVLVLVGFRYMGAVYANTTGVSYATHGIRGNSAATKCPLGDLLNTDTYVTGWTGTADSELIVAQAGFQLYADVPRSVEVKRMWYVVTLEGNGDGVKINGVAGKTFTTDKITAPAQDVMPDRWYFMPAFTFKLTNPFVGKVHVDAWADRQWNFGLSGGAAILASDEAYLKSGVGRIHLTTDVFEEGTEAAFNVETGYSHSTNDAVSASDEGWYLNIYDPSGNMVWQKTLNDNFNGEVKWPIPLGTYKAEWNNRFAVVLRNELIDQDQRVVYTVGPGMLIKKPNKPECSLIIGEEPFTKGESITVRVSATQNPLGYPIAGFTISIVSTSSAGAVTDYIIKDAFYPSQKGEGTSYFADVTFAFPEAGYAELWGNTVDTKNLNSGNTMLKFSVAGMGPPSDDDKKTGIDVMVVVAVVLIILAVLGSMLMLIFRPIPFAIVVGIGMLVAAVVGIWYVVMVML